jgi:peptide/nickel transport system permease protein
MNEPMTTSGGSIGSGPAMTSPANMPQAASGAAFGPALSRFADNPWLNGKLITGMALILFMVLIGILGPLLWDTTLARTGSSPLNLPPVWVDGGVWNHPLGTENSGRDVLALLVVGVPSALSVGVIAAGIGLLIGIILGFTSGFLGGWVDSVIRTVTDSLLTLPSLAVLIVISAYIRTVSPYTMALILAIFAWQGPTRILRAQVLSLRDRGYVRMARASNASTPSIMFREMLPNILPFIASSFTGSVSGAILAATGLEVLGLGPTRIPTLGMTIYYAMRAAAITRGMWWWWGMPILALVIIFIGLFLISIGLDEIANPRLRGEQNQK